MYILYYLLSLGAMVMAMFADLSTRGVGFLVVMALVFLFLGSWNLLSRRVESQRRSERHIISPDELQRMRELAEQAKGRKSDNNGNDA
ncbi:hypothetical protein [Arenimonas sp.]|jgi:hypothetical protein|uniref:hypothetical protein n=1 Tax=Arenimonas sp. TaxID=1872635 RepID=UPI0037C14947